MIKAVVICEDHSLDSFIIEPVIEKIFASYRRKAQIEFVSRNLIQGVDQALQKGKHEEVFAWYPMANVFFLVIDRDCKSNRETKVAQRVADAQEVGKTLLGCVAIEEVEVWALALHRKKLADKWETIQTDCDPKENYFIPFVTRMGWKTGIGKGRQNAVANLAKRWDALKNSCPEVAKLADDVGTWLADHQM